MDTGAKCDVRKWQHVRPRTMTDERGNWTPERSETFGSGRVYVSRLWSNARRSEVAAYMLVD